MMITILESLLIEMKKENKHVTDLRKSEILLFWQGMGSWIVKVLLCFLMLHILSQILHIKIIKTIKFVVGEGTEKVLMVHWAFHFSNHMATAFRDVLYILFQLSYFSDSKTPLSHFIISEIRCILLFMAAYNCFCPSRLMWYSCHWLNIVRDV